MNRYKNVYLSSDNLLALLHGIYTWTTPEGRQIEKSRQHKTHWPACCAIQQRTAHSTASATSPCTTIQHQITSHFCHSKPFMYLPKLQYNTVDRVAKCGILKCLYSIIYGHHKNHSSLDLKRVIPAVGNQTSPIIALATTV